MLPEIINKYLTLCQIMAVLICGVFVEECKGVVQNKPSRGRRSVLEFSDTWHEASSVTDDISHDDLIKERHDGHYHQLPDKYTSTDGMVPAEVTHIYRLVPETTSPKSGLVRDLTIDDSPLQRHKSRDQLKHMNRLRKNDLEREPDNEGWKSRGQSKKKWRKRLKALKKQYYQKCTISSSVECQRLLAKITLALSGHKNNRRFRLNFPPVDFLLCMNGTSIVHFNPKEEVCCNGVFPKTSGYEECCNGRIIDNRQHFCCNDELYNKTDNNDCCGTHRFNVETEICCQGNLFSRLFGSSCCDDIVYDPSWELCCFDMFKANLSVGDSCCGRNVYNSSANMCCGTSIQPIYGKNNRKGGCCKDKSYHSSCYTCEDDVIIPVFNEMEQVCCDGKITDRKYGNNTGCCLRRIINRQSQICHSDGSISNVTSPGLNYSSEGTISTYIDYNDIDGGDLDDELGMGLPEAKHSGTSHEFIIIIVIVCSGSIVAACLIIVMKLCQSKGYKPNNTQQSDIEPLNNQAMSESNLCDAAHPMNANPLPTNDVIFRTASTTKESAFLKKEKPNIETLDANILSNHYKDTFTQTYPEKQSNRRNVLGKPYEHNFILGLANATAQMPNSDAKMTLPQSVLKQNKVEVNCTTFRTVVPLRKKFGLTDSEIIASPVVEYALTGYGNLQDFAVVVLPFLGPPTELKVKKFKSDEGLSTVVKTIDVPRQEKRNENKDVFYIIKDSEVYIYTKTFSGFYCTTCRHRPIRLRCFLFGSYKRFINPVRHDVRIMVYFADDLMKFADYKERMFMNEDAGGRVLKKEMLLRLPNELTEDDCIEVSLTPNQLAQWTHKQHPVLNVPIYPACQILHMYDVAEKCNSCKFCHLPEHDIPDYVEWYLTNTDGVIPDYTFQCIVDIDVTNAADNTKTSTRIIIDELQLRHEDRYPIEEQHTVRSLQGVKEYIAGSLSPAKRWEVLEVLISKFRISGTTLEEVFFKLHEKLTPKYILEAVATAMREKHMFDELQVLQTYGFLPQNFALSSLQPVLDDSTEQAHPENDTMFQSINENNSSDQSISEFETFELTSRQIPTTVQQFEESNNVELLCPQYSDIGQQSTNNVIAVPASSDVRNIGQNNLIGSTTPHSGVNFNVTGPNDIVTLADMRNGLQCCPRDVSPGESADRQKTSSRGTLNLAERQGAIPKTENPHGRKTNNTVLQAFQNQAEQLGIEKKKGYPHGMVQKNDMNKFLNIKPKPESQETSSLESCNSCNGQSYWNVSTRNEPTENLKFPKKRSAENQIELENVRPELSTTHRMQLQNSEEDSTLTEIPSINGARGELTSPIVDSMSSSETQTLHVQECASHDETYAKERMKENE